MGLQRTCLNHLETEANYFVQCAAVYINTNSICACLRMVAFDITYVCKFVRGHVSEIFGPGITTKNRIGTDPSVPHRWDVPPG